MNQINTLLNKQDNSEKIRDQIAALLTLELKNQFTLASNQKIEDHKDFNINVYIENSRPWQLVRENKNPFPLINVCLNKIEEETTPGNDAKKKYTGQFYVDCWGCGNVNNETENFTNDDYLATIRAWKTARIARNVLMSGFYTYLGIRQLVRKRRIASITTIIPNLTESALAVVACRIILEVDFYEESPQADATELDGISFTSDDSGNVRLIDI